MTGRKIPYTKARAIAHMQYNEVYKNERKKLKRQARREERRYLAQIDRLNSEIYDVLFSTVECFQIQHPYLGYKFNDNMTYGIVWIRGFIPACMASFIIDSIGSTQFLEAATNAVVEAYTRRKNA